MLTFLDLFRARFTAVWFVLVAATLLSFSLGGIHGLNSAKMIAVAVLVVAFVKVRLVGIHFMGLRDSPLVLRLIFEGYGIGLCTVLVGFYLFA